MGGSDGNWTQWPVWSIIIRPAAEKSTHRDPVGLETTSEDRAMYFGPASRRATVAQCNDLAFVVSKIIVPFGAGTCFDRWIDRGLWTTGPNGHQRNVGRVYRLATLFYYSDWSRIRGLKLKWTKRNVGRRKIWCKGGWRRVGVRSSQPSSCWR